MGTKSWHRTAATRHIDRPQIKSWRNSTRAAVWSATAATQSAPSVDSGETSTIDEPTLMLSATASGSPPPTRSTSALMVGRNAGRTTPDVLLQLEISAVMNAIVPLIVAGV